MTAQVSAPPSPNDPSPSCSTPATQPHPHSRHGRTSQPSTNQRQVGHWSTQSQTSSPLKCDFSPESGQSGRAKGSTMHPGPRNCGTLAGVARYGDEYAEAPRRDVPQCNAVGGQQELERDAAADCAASAPA